MSAKRSSVLIDDEVADSIDRCVLAWLATASRDGVPNVSPKEIFAAVDGRRVAIAHIASPRSVRNARANPAGCLSLVDVFRQRGFKLSGSLRVIDPGDQAFAGLLPPLQARLGGADFTVRAIIELTVESVAPILAPSYVFHPESATEDSMIGQAMLAYGVQPRVDGS